MAESASASTSVWYFIGATFIVALPMMLFPDMPWWVRLGSIVSALIVMTAGGVQLRKELRERNSRGGDSSSD